MAITGIFGADFSSFNDAVQSADVKLRAFEDDADKVARSLTKMTQSFSGTKVIQDATLMVQAVESLGGTAKLTEAEFKRFGITVNEAVDKMRAMGGDVPENMAKYAAETKSATQATGGFTSALSVTKGVLGAMGLDIAVSGLINFAKGAVHTAATLDDMSTATGISTDALQRMAYAGADSGLTLDLIAKSASKLAEDLAAPGPNSAKSAVEALGLSVDRMVAAGPEEAFLQIGEALGRIEDPMLKASTAADVFGAKVAKELVPSLGDLRSKMQEVPTDALISPEVIASADAFEAAMSRAVMRMEAWLLRAGEMAGEGAKKVADALAASGGGPMDQKTFADFLDQAPKVYAEAAKIEEANRAAAASFTEFVGPVQQALTKADLLNNRLKALREEGVVTLTAEQKANIDELLRFKVSHQEIAQLIEGVTVPALELYITKQEAAKEETKLATAEMKKAWEDLASFRENADKRQLEIMKQLQAAELQRAAEVNAQVAAELDARAKLNAAYGLDVEGHAKMTSALDTYMQKLDALHTKKQEGISQAAQEQLLMDEYTTALYEEAKAQDAATIAAAKAPPAVAAVGNAMDGAARQTGVFMQQLHMLVNDPKLAAFFGNSAQGAAATTLYGGGSNGITPEMAAAIAAGQFIQMAGVGAVGLQRRAAGGPTTGGTPYLVGERGPELFVPTTNGRVVPNHQINNFQVNGTAEDVAKKIFEILSRSVRQGVKLGAS